MAVKIRLARRGRKKKAIYDVVVANASAPRDGRFIDRLGIYNPASNPATIEIDEDKALKWLMNGAQPTDTVKAILSYRGVLLRKHLQVGVVKGAISQEQADAKFEEWKQSKEEKITGKKDSLEKQKHDSAKARKEAEEKVKEARAEALKKKNAVPEEAPVEEPAAQEVETAVAEEAAPETVESTPESKEATAEAAENTPEAKEATAEAAESAPEVTEKAPEAQETPAAEGGDEKQQ